MVRSSSSSIHGVFLEEIGNERFQFLLRCHVVGIDNGYRDQRTTTTWSGRIVVINMNRGIGIGIGISSSIIIICTVSSSTSSRCRRRCRIRIGHDRCDSIPTMQPSLGFQHGFDWFGRRCRYHDNVHDITPRHFRFGGCCCCYNYKESVIIVAGSYVCVCARCWSSVRPQHTSGVASYRRTRRAAAAHIVVVCVYATHCAI